MVRIKFRLFSGKVGCPKRMSKDSRSERSTVGHGKVMIHPVIGKAMGTSDQYDCIRAK